MKLIRPQKGKIILLSSLKSAIRRSKPSKRLRNTFQKITGKGNIIRLYNDRGPSIA